MAPQPSELAIHAGTVDECSSVLEFWGSSGAESTVTDSLASLMRLLAVDEGALHVATIDGMIVGTVIAGWDGWRGGLYRLVVHPGFRRRGVATQLVLTGERHLLKRGAVRIDAIVLDNDEVATRFWTSASYRLHGGRARFVRNL